MITELAPILFSSLLVSSLLFSSSQTKDRDNHSLTSRTGLNRASIKQTQACTHMGTQASSQTRTPFSCRLHNWTNPHQRQVSKQTKQMFCYNSANLARDFRQDVMQTQSTISSHYHTIVCYRTVSQSRTV